MNANIQWLQQTIAPLSRNQMPNNEILRESYDLYKEFSYNWSDYSDIQQEPDTLATVGDFRKKYEEYIAKHPADKPKADKPKSEKKAAEKPKETSKAADKPTFKKGDYIELPIKGAYGVVKKVTESGYEVSFATSDSSVVLWEEQIHKATKAAFEKQKKAFTQAKDKPKKEAPAKKPAVKKAVAEKKPKKPKAEKKPAVSEKQTEKGEETLRKLKAENREFEKQIMTDSDFLKDMVKLINKHEKASLGLGALPVKLSNDIKKERALNTLYKRVLKRDIKSFKALEKKAKAANELPPKLEQQFYALYDTLSGLKLSAVAKRSGKPGKSKSAANASKTAKSKRAKTGKPKMKPKTAAPKKKSFFERLFS
jgi:hypothetical protein